MKNRKGITLISLVITITVLIILTSIATYSGIGVINSSKLTAFTTEMKIMQTQVNAIYQKYKENDVIELDGSIYYGEAEKENTDKQTILEIGQEITGGSIKGQADKVFAELKNDTESGITSQEGYRYWSQELIEKLGIEGIEQDFFVNIQTRSVVSYEGFKYEGKMYYTLNQLPNSLYNVEYTNPNEGGPTFEVEIKNIGTNKWRITIPKGSIHYKDGYIDKWQVKYQLEGKNFWNTTEDLNFVVNASGKYLIKIVNGNIESDSQIIFVGSYYDKTKSVNTPDLNEDMIPIYWNDSKQERELTSTSSTEEWNNWYEYVAGDNKTDTKNSKWANAKTRDGSYWVWIPRFAYKINSNQTIDVKFLLGTTDQYYDENGSLQIAKRVTAKNETVDTTSNYYVHPAFIDESSMDYIHGGWDQELAGIWVAKYESSKSNATESSEGSSSTLKVVPGVQSWRNITIGDSYTTAYNYDRAKESHLMKNSEWGAVAYLTQSQYGRNGHETDINNSSTHITGNGGGGVGGSVSAASGVTNAYDTETGAKASSTGNIYGIYDLSGGAWERVAAYITNGDGSLSSYGQSFAYTTADPEGYKTRSTKYATVYPYNSSDDNNTNNYTTYKNASYGYGDAVAETSSSGSGSTSWFSDFSYFPYASLPFFLRGGYYDNGADAGVFCFIDTVGYSGSFVSFRVVLAGI